MIQMRANIVAMGVAGAVLLLPELAQAGQVGHASWYALHSRTASGEMMNPSAMTAAHRSLPFGTKVLVENLNNGKSVVVRINDRGPFVKGRIIDVSKAAASVLGIIGSGTARVKVSTAGSASHQIAAKEQGSTKVASTTAKMGEAGDKVAAADLEPVKSAKMEGDSSAELVKVSTASKKTPVKVAHTSRKSTNVAHASRKSSTRTAKASTKSAKIVTASRSKRPVRGEPRAVAGLMGSTREIRRVASRTSRKGYAVASHAGARKSVGVASRELRRGRSAKSVVMASSANPYGAFTRSVSFVN
jgi:rare lipoprotein A